MHLDIIPCSEFPDYELPEQAGTLQDVKTLRSDVELTHEIIVWTNTHVSHIGYVIRGRLFLQAPKLGVARVSRCRRYCAAVLDVRLLDWLQNLVAIVTTSITRSRSEVGRMGADQVSTSPFPSTWWNIFFMESED
jgi:hypothetical protein